MISPLITKLTHCSNIFPELEQNLLNQMCTDFKLIEDELNSLIIDENINVVDEFNKKNIITSKYKYINVAIFVPQ